MAHKEAEDAVTVLNHLGNPAYGLTAEPLDRWEQRAVCGIDPDLWHTSDSAINWTRVAEARHICLHHCPVVRQCHDSIGPMRSAVVGGVFYGQDRRQATYQPIAARCRICAPSAKAARP